MICREISTLNFSAYLALLLRYSSVYIDRSNDEQCSFRNCDRWDSCSDIVQMLLCETLFANHEGPHNGSIMVLCSMKSCITASLFLRLAYRNIATVSI